MAIRVICPGCMTSFEVDDRFAGKKGPCPKCGHIIEIPKEKLVVHAPDEVTAGGKTMKMSGHDARPILQRRFVFTGKQVLFGALGVAAAFAIAYLVGTLNNPTLAAIVGAIGLFAIAFPIADFGYMLIRDDDDLEMFLGGERHKRALFASLVFAGSWIVFELFVHFLGHQGVGTCFYLIPIAAIGAFGALIFFDCNFGKALLVYLIFAFATIIGRGLILSPNGWIWKEATAVAASVDKKAEPTVKEEIKTESPAPSGDAQTTEESAASVDKEAKSAPAPKKLTKEAPKVDLGKRRRM